MTKIFRGILRDGEWESSTLLDGRGVILLHKTEVWEGVILLHGEGGVKAGKGDKIIAFAALWCLFLAGADASLIKYSPVREFLPRETYGTFSKCWNHNSFLILRHILEFQPRPLFTESVCSVVSDTLLEINRFLTTTSVGLVNRLIWEF